MRVLAAALPAVLALAALAPRPADAWWRGGFFVGVSPGIVVAPPPVVYGPPAYYPYPPPYYPPPYGYAPPPPSYGYAPPQNYTPNYNPPAYNPPSYTPPAEDQGAEQSPAPSQQPQTQAANQPPPGPYGATCNASPYFCPAPAYTQVGARCACPGLGAPSYGTAQ